MTTEMFDILIAGPQAPLEDFLIHLEAQKCYRLHYAVDLESARAYLKEHTPYAIVVSVPVEDQYDAEVLAWLETAKQQAPVLVFCPLAEVHFYMDAMDHGAFDLFTAQTPLQEIDRELNNAVNWSAFQAA